MQGSWVILSAHKQSIWISENWVSTCFGSCCLTSAVHVRCSPLSQRFRVRSPLPAGTILQQSFPLIHQKTWGTWDVMCWVQLFRSPKMLPGVKISAISESNSSRQMSRTLTCAWSLPKCPRLPFSQFVDHCLQNPSDVAENARHRKTAHVSVELIILPSYKRSGNSRLCRFLARHQASLSTKILFLASTNLKECFPKGRQHSPGQTCILHSKKVHCFFPRYFYSCGKHSSCVRAIMQDSGCIRSCRILDLWVSAEIASNAEEDWWGHSFFQGS